MLAPFFNPAGVAVIGASGKPGKLGYGVVRNLIKSGYRGAIYPVNPKAKEILGLSCYPAIADTPDPLDLAIIVVAAPIAAKMLQQCGQRGVKHAIVVSGGFKELGTEGTAREEELIHIAQQYGIRLIGPNCIGTIDTHTPLNTTFLAGMPAPGDIAFMSQSGAMCAVVIDWAQGAGVGFSRIVSSGNQSDVNESDLLAALNDDLHTRVIAAYIEGVSDGRAFMQLAARVARNKPIVALKGGRGESGLQAVASHTGSLAGSAEAYAAAFKQSGVLQARTTEDLLYWARALAWQPLPSGKNVAVLTNAGGPGIAAVDALEVAGLQLAPLSAETRAFLRAHLPPAASVNNPVDILAGSGPQVYGLALEALLQDPAVDAALVISAPNDWYSPAELAEVIADVAEGRWGEGEQGSMGVGEQGSRGVGERRKSKGQRTRDKGQKPALVSLIGSVGMEEAWEVMNRRRLPNFAFPEGAAPALAAMLARRKWLERPQEAPPVFDDVDAGAAERALQTNDFAGLLAAYGAALPPQQRAKSAKEAAQAADKIGYPVALKLLSPDISHKSDVGGVRLNLSNASAVRLAFAEIIAAARAVAPNAGVEGVLVQKMLRDGQEVIVGFKRDPQFGPLILVGSGGVEVELLRDIATGVAPLTRSQAEDLLNSTFAGKRLKGWRALPPADRTAVVDVMLRMAQIALDFPELVELEINPLLVFPAKEGAVAVDVRGSHPRLCT